MSDVKFYNVYVGKYNSVSISKKDIKKLNDLGLRGYLFSMGEYYSIKVSGFIHQIQAENLRKILEQKGFEAYIA